MNDVLVKASSIFKPEYSDLKMSKYCFEYEISIINQTNNKVKLLSRHFNIHNSLVWNITPEKNTLLVFNSMLAHRIAQNTSKNTRYSIASNMMPKGVIGFHDTKVVL